MCSLESEALEYLKTRTLSERAILQSIVNGIDLPFLYSVAYTERIGRMLLAFTNSTGCELTAGQFWWVLRMLLAAGDAGAQECL